MSTYTTLERRETTRAEIDEGLARLRERAGPFVRLPLSTRIELLRGLLARTESTVAASVQAACHAKRIAPGSAAEGEEWFAGPVIQVRHIRLLVEALEDIEQLGAPRVAWRRATYTDEGRLSIPVFPMTAPERLLFTGFSAHTIMDEGVDVETAKARQAGLYRDASPKGGVSLVLGAGNVASIGPLDVLYKMFVEGRVCVLKMNPVNDYLGPFIEQQFEAFIDAGYLRVVYGGADVGAYLTKHEAVDDIHMTGSDQTHDAIVWGPSGPKRELRKHRGEPLISKPITSELGNITPVIVTPGPYDDDEIAAMASNIAAMIVNNASFNCNAAKLLVTARGWPLRHLLIDALGEVLSKTPPRHAYYPGAFKRYGVLTHRQREVRTFGTAPEGSLPWTLLTGVDPGDDGNAAFRTEPFCSVISEVNLGSIDPEAFLDEAVAFVNDRVWGTLSATLFVHPSLERDRRTRPAVERAIADLRYGTVAVNHWSALGYAFCSTPWGAAPGSSLDDIQSGIGWVHNTPMLDGVHKSVIRGPIVVRPKPAWYPDHRNSVALGKRMVHFEANPRWLRVPSVVREALKG